MTNHHYPYYYHYYYHPWPCNSRGTYIPEKVYGILCPISFFCAFTHYSFAQDVYIERRAKDRASGVISPLNPRPSNRSPEAAITSSEGIKSSFQDRYALLGTLSTHRHACQLHSFGTSSVCQKQVCGWTSSPVIIYIEKTFHSVATWQKVPFRDDFGKKEENFLSHYANEYHGAIAMIPAISTSKFLP